MKTYTPQQGSIAWKVIEFFTTNPDEALTLQDLEAKFDKGASQFHSLLGAAVEAGVLKREPNPDEDLVYSLGTGSPLIEANHARNPTSRPDALLAGSSLGFKRNVKPALVATVINPAEIPLLDNVPMPGRGKAPTDWPALFRRMKVNQSCVLPIAMRSVLNKACTDAKKSGIGTFALRKINEEKVGVWRLS